MARRLEALPIEALLPEIVGVLARGRALVLQAPPGAGKTTRVPPALLDAGVAKEGCVMLIEPRRIAARAAAARIAAERGVALGSEVGYEVRFDRRAGPETRILAVTDGLLLRKLAADPFLSQASVVIFDEFHERRLEADLALALLRRLRAEVRPELKLAVMSATLDAAPLAAWLGEAEVLSGCGRAHPVEIRYRASPPRNMLPAAMARAIGEALEQTHGDVLAFLPGLHEIRRTKRELAVLRSFTNVVVQELYGDMPLEEQQAVLRSGQYGGPSDCRRVVLATNVAETSVTVEGVTAVVDSGLVREVRLDRRLGLNRLETVRVSKASADQRAGRAGRLGPGLCLRLWSEREQRGLADFHSPEVKRVEISGPVLQMFDAGEPDVLAFPWFEAPPQLAVEQAVSLLERLGAVADGRITPLGRMMAKLPIEPRLARLLLEARRWGHAERGALAAALLSEPDPFRTEAGAQAEHRSQSDVLDRVAMLEEFAERGRTQRIDKRLNCAAARRVLRAASQLARLVQSELQGDCAVLDADEALLRALAAAFADRLARRRAPRSRRALMVGGRGVVLAHTSSVTEPELFVCVEVNERGGQEAVVELASAVQPEWLPEHLIVTSVEVEFDPERERVAAWRRTRFAGLTIAEAPAPLPPQASERLAAEVAKRWGKDLHPGPDEEAFLARVALVRQHLPELHLPDLGPDPWPSVLRAWCQGASSLAELRAIPLLDALKAAFTPQQLAQIDREAPERLSMPSGSRVRLRYAAGKPPVLAVRIQELFGLRETPRICAGRVPVVLELLAPNHRTQQITTDLASFWANTYPQVRKELARRYPKHAWPEDPLAAIPAGRDRHKSRS